MKPNIKKISKKVLEYLIIPAFISIVTGPFLIELACKWRSNSTFAFRLMKKLQDKEVPLPNVEIDIVGNNTYKTDSLGYFKITIENNKSKIPFISCKDCEDLHKYIYIVYYNDNEIKNEIIMDTRNIENKSTRIIYVP
jgi:hypothetical protein